MARPDLRYATSRAAAAAVATWHHLALTAIRRQARQLGHHRGALTGQFRRWDHLAARLEAIAVASSSDPARAAPHHLCATLHLDDTELAARLRSVWHRGHDGIRHPATVHHTAAELDAAWERLTDDPPRRLARLELESQRLVALHRDPLRRRLASHTADQGAVVDRALEQHLYELVADGHTRDEVLRALRRTRLDTRRHMPADHLAICADLLADIDRAAQDACARTAHLHTWLLVRPGHRSWHPAARLESRGNRIHSSGQWTPLGLAAVALGAVAARRDGDGHLLRIPAGLADTFTGDVAHLDGFDERLAELTVALWDRDGLDAAQAHATAAALTDGPATAAPAT